jgi:hypothetical protein
MSGAPIGSLRVDFQPSEPVFGDWLTVTQQLMAKSGPQQAPYWWKSNKKPTTNQCRPAARSSHFKLVAIKSTQVIDLKCLIGEVSLKRQALRHGNQPKFEYGICTILMYKIYTKVL